MQYVKKLPKDLSVRLSQSSCYKALYEKSHDKLLKIPLPKPSTVNKALYEKSHDKLLKIPPPKPSTIKLLMK